MPSQRPDQAVLLLSGGMDSTTLLWWMRDRGISEIHTIAVDYDQRHRVELQASEALSALAGAASHRCLALDLTQIGGSPLTDGELAVPDASQGQQARTVVPFRNTLFVTLAAAWAETAGIRHIYLSPVKDDHEAFRDCRRPFYDALENALSLGATHDTRVQIHTPFICMWKAEVVRLGMELRVPYEQTHTCYEGAKPGCGRCDACVERAAAFRDNGLPDPLSCC
jgi:7-cyano-7-deazaguanine synthase